MLGDQASFCQVRPRSAVGSGASDYGTVGDSASFVVDASRESLRAGEGEKPVRGACLCSAVQGKSTVDSCGTDAHDHR
jgi:hypothetical protein